MATPVWIDGWEYNQDNGKPYLTEYFKSTGEYNRTAALTWWLWAQGGVWQATDVTTRFKNTTNNALKMTKLGIRTCACDSGGLSYWSNGGLITTPCKGYGGTYYAYIRVSNDGGVTYQDSQIATNVIPNIDGTNMNSQGSSKTVTAQFGEPPYTGYKAFIHREYTIADCPVIQPGGIAVIHLGIASLNGPAGKTVIKFNLDPGDMEVYMEEDDRPYYWIYQDDKKWHLTKSAYVWKDGAWKILEESLI